jgi:hypothetical protein
MLIRELLTEAAYDSMVDAMLRQYPDDREYIQSHVDWARGTLKKADRVTWYLRIIRALLEGNEVFNQLRGTYRWMDEATFQSQLAHYYGFNYQPIENYQFQRQTISDVFADLSALEQQWQARQEKSSGLTPQEGDHKLFDFDDGTAWWWVDRAYCEQEGRSGQHCGNITGQQQPDQRILSLRTKTGQVILTFILEPDGRLGEMKAKANQKPSVRYHPHIIKLLLWDRVTGIQGQGYAPERNFSMFDLSARDLEYMESVKPQLIADQVQSRPLDLLRCQSETIKMKYANQLPEDSTLRYVILEPDNMDHWQAYVSVDPFRVFDAPPEMPGYGETVLQLADESANGMYEDILGQLPLDVLKNTELVKQIIITDHQQLETADISNPEIALMQELNDGLELSEIPSKKRTLDVCRFAVKYSYEPEDTIKSVPKKYREQVEQEAWDW